MEGFPITALSVCNALGSEPRAVGDALMGGVAGPQRTSSRGVFGALPRDLPRLPESLRAYDTRQARIAGVLAAPLSSRIHAIADCCGPTRIGVVVGTSTGGIAHTESAIAYRVQNGGLPPEFDLWRRHAMSATLEVVAHLCRADGPGIIVSTACSSSLKAFALARGLLEADIVDAVVVGGLDSCCQLTVAGFGALEVVSDAPCRPFSRERAGLNLGEGGALMVLERNGNGLAHLAGVGESNDAHHMSAPHPEGRGAVLAMQRALADAGLAPDEVGYVHAHGTATAAGDAVEAHAIASVFGPTKPVWATKAATGHTLGAAGATALALTILAGQRGMLAASRGADPVDPTLAIDVVASDRPVPAGAVLCNAFAFGGNNASLVVGGIA